MRYRTKLILSLAFLVSWASAQAGTLPDFRRRSLNFIVVSDSGEKTDSLRARASILADHMDSLVRRGGISFVLHAGDQIHDKGVKDALDPEWKFKLLDVYERDALMSIPWHAVPGNHEYRSNPDAVAEYSSVQPWWETPSRYYSIEEGDVLILMLDTTPLIDSYRCEEKGLVNVGYSQEELHWADSTLAASNARWKIVVGHHPVYSVTEKKSRERADMRKRIVPLLRNHGVRLYVNGHIHNFQHIVDDGGISYITNASSVKTRAAAAGKGTRFCDPGPGFTVVSVSRRSMEVFFVNGSGDVIYSTRIIRKQMADKN